MAGLTAVIFDYYETLAELSPNVRDRTFDDLARRVGVDLPPGEAYRHWRELAVSDWKLRLGGQRPPLDGPTVPFVTFREVWTERSRQLLEQWGVDAPADLGFHAYRDAHANAVVYPDVLPALDALRARYRLAVLSDADSDFITASMDRNGLSFEAVVTSQEQRVYKPHVSIFREACGRLGIEPSEAVYVGDNPWADVAGARNAGMRSVWINRHDATWPDEAEPADAQVSSLAELEAVLAALA